VTCTGSVFQMRAPATGKARQSMVVSRTAGTIMSSEVRGPESVARRHVGDKDELLQILWYVAGHRTIGQDGNLVGNALRRDTCCCLITCDILTVFTG